MRNFYHLRKLVIGSIFGVLLLAGTITISGQNTMKEYRDWQMAQARAQQEHQDYLRTHSNRDYNQWQAAQRRAQEQYLQYQRALSRQNTGYNSNNNNGYYNNSSYNNSGRYRVYRNGSYYSTDSRGAELLRQAVRNGYSEGYRRGQTDKRYSRPFDYTIDSMYRSGSHGYQSYVERNQYQYYFQQGFQRGYEDGYNNTYRYGSREGNGFNILSGVLNTILNITNP